MTGCQNLRHDALTGHQISAGHKEAVLLHNAKFVSADDKANEPATQVIKSLNQQNVSRLSMLFRNPHVLMKFF